MPYQVLYRAWRPNSWHDVVGQTAVVRILQNALLQDKVSHAYLFSGPRGTGKTTVARLLAKAVNCKQRQEAEPCNSCDSCVAIQNGTSVDVVEVDAASNRGIDEVRGITDSTRYLPVMGAYKVYIVDEVHMLTQEAFNALLKTLEEPPAHVIFILATTAPHRIPATITSRCQRMDFRRLSVAEIRERLDEIASAEMIEMEPDAGEALARAGEGSLRDAISLLDLCAAYGGGKVTRRAVEAVLGSSSLDFMERLLTSLARGDARETLKLLREASDAGKEFFQLAQEIGSFARDLIFLKSGGRPTDLPRPPEDSRRLSELASGIQGGLLFSLLDATARAMSDMRGAPDPRLVLEIALLGLIRPASLKGTPPAPEDVHVGGGAVRAPEGEEEQVPATPAQDRSPGVSLAGPDEVLQRVKDVWAELLESLQKRRLVKARAYLLPGKPAAVQGGNVVVLRFPTAYRTHIEQVMVPATRRSIETELSRLTGLSLRISAVGDEQGTGAGDDCTADSSGSGNGENLLVTRALELLDAAARKKSALKN